MIYTLNNTTGSNIVIGSFTFVPATPQVVFMSEGLFSSPSNVGTLLGHLGSGDLVASDLNGDTIAAATAKEQVQNVFYAYVAYGSWSWPGYVGAKAVDAIVHTIDQFNFAGAGVTKSRKVTFTRLYKTFQLLLSGMLEDAKNALLETVPDITPEFLVESRLNSFLHAVQSSNGDTVADWTWKTGNFTFVFFPDTQGYVDSTSLRLEPLQDQVDWVIAQQSARQIEIVAHTGDLVEDESVQDEWDDIVYEMERLRTAGIRYAVTGGNHDGENRASANFNAEFPQSWFSGDSRFMEWYETGDIWNSAWDLSTENAKIMCVMLEIGPRQEVQNWVKNLSVRYPDWTMMVVTHAYLQVEETTYNSIVLPAGASGDPRYYGFEDAIHCEAMTDFFDTIPNLLLVMCGHRGLPADSISHLSAVNDAGNTRFAHMLNVQYTGNNGWISLLEFKTNDNQIDLKTYSPYLDSWDTSSDAELTMSVPMDGSFYTPPTYPVTDNITCLSGGFTEELVATGAIANVNPSDVELGEDNAGEQVCGVHFILSVPRGATIHSASISFRADESHSVPCSLAIDVEDTLWAPELTTNDYDISSRTLTGSPVSWANVEAWTTGNWYSTPDLASLVQHLVDKPFWNVDNPCIFVVSQAGASGRRVAEAAGVAGNEPILTVEWSL